MSFAALAHLVERHLAKVEVASSSLVSRSKKTSFVYQDIRGFFMLLGQKRPKYRRPVFFTRDPIVHFQNPMKLFLSILKKKGMKLPARYGKAISMGSGIKTMKVSGCQRHRYRSGKKRNNPKRVLLMRILFSPALHMRGNPSCLTLRKWEGKQQRSTFNGFPSVKNQHSVIRLR